MGLDAKDIEGILILVLGRCLVCGYLDPWGQDEGGSALPLAAKGPDA